MKVPRTYVVEVTIMTEWQGDNAEDAAISFAKLVDKRLDGMIDIDKSMMVWKTYKKSRSKQKKAPRLKGA